MGSCDVPRPRRSRRRRRRSSSSRQDEGAAAVAAARSVGITERGRGWPASDAWVSVYTLHGAAAPSTARHWPAEMTCWSLQRALACMNRPGARETQFTSLRPRYPSLAPCRAQALRSSPHLAMNGWMLRDTRTAAMWCCSRSLCRPGFTMASATCRVQSLRRLAQTLLLSRSSA